MTICNNPRCTVNRQGIKHEFHKLADNKVPKSTILSREQKLVIVTGIAVAVESFFVYFALDSWFPELKQIGNFESLFVEIGIAIFITVTVYLYASKPERERKIRLQRQIISSFEMLSTDFAWFSTQTASTTLDEGFIQKKDLRVFHIQNLIGQLPKKIGTKLSLSIPDLCERALLSPRIIKPLDQTKSISVDYTECLELVKSIKNVLEDLKNEWNIK